MAENFQCMICGAPATVHLTQIVDGKIRKMHFCEKCAKGNLPEDATLKFAEMLAKISAAGGKVPASAAGGVTRKAKKTCPECGMTDVDFEQNNMLGCEHCYEVFADELAAVLPKNRRGNAYCGEHGNTAAPKSRTGTPAAASAEPRERRKTPDELRKALKAAVAKENYALAAKLRDELRAAEKSGSGKKSSRKSSGAKGDSAGGNAASEGKGNS